MNLIPALLPIGIYGRGLATFAVLTLRGSTGFHLLSEAQAAGGTPLQTANGYGVVASAPLITVVLMHPYFPTYQHYFRGHVPAGRPGRPPGPRAGRRGARVQTRRGLLITTRSLTKQYGSVTAVRSVDIDVREGDRYGLLGPNGSGKTTLVRMLLGLVFATSGEIEVLGCRMPRHASRVLRDVGALVEGPAAYPNLSGRTNLKLLDAAGPRGDRRTRRRRIDDALEQVGLAGIDRRPVKAYSLGMRQRLGLAAALVRRPRLLILDEPGNGLDPHGIRDTRELLLDLNQDGVTIFLSSHLLAEVEQLCTRVGILDRGRLVLQEGLDTLRAPTGRVLVDSPDAGQAAALLNGEVEQRDGTRLVVRHPDAAALNARLVRAGVRVSSIGPQIRTLEEVVLEVTGAGSDQLAGPAAGTGTTGTGAGTGRNRPGAGTRNGPPPPGAAGDTAVPGARR